MKKKKNTKTKHNNYKLHQIQIKRYKCQQIRFFVVIFLFYNNSYFIFRTKKIYFFCFYEKQQQVIKLLG